MTFNAGFDRAVDTILEFYIGHFDEDYEFRGKETLFEDFADDVQDEEDIYMVSVYTYDSDSDELKNGIKAALDELKYYITGSKAEKPSGVISMTWKD